MTKQEKVVKLRQEGISYRKISEITGLPLGTVKSICSRQGDGVLETSKCKACGIEIKSIKGKKAKIFCSDSCRMNWWNAHREQVKGGRTHKFVCENCQREFTAQGNQPRKYCSHACYIEKRYGNDE